MPAYYNEIDPFAAAWLRNLISAGHIAAGDVDERSIEDVTPNDLKEYTQCHFFAGIGGWSYALRLAGWPDDRPVWTGSCPCQPFSAAGKKSGIADERHLWPAFFHLIEQCSPATIFGEQVASKDGLAWLDIVSSDLEGKNYSFGATDICAAGFGAPHVRQRLYFVAHSEGTEQPRSKPETGRAMGHSPSSSLADPIGSGQHGRGQHNGFETETIGSGPPIGGSDRKQTSEFGFVGGFWGNAEWIRCLDNRQRPIEPGTFPLAHGVSQKVGRLRGYGNAIVAPQAQAFVEAYLKSTENGFSS